MAASILDDLYQRVRDVVPPAEWQIEAPFIEEILRLKEEKDAVILAHTYQSAAIYNCIADIRGDSLQLAKEATNVDASTIVMCGVKFMAETAKILNPAKKVLLPDLAAGCSMANSITAADVIRLRAEYPGAPVVSYVNTNADVKAETDICCTSSNAVQVVRSLAEKQIIFLPDPYLGKWVQSQLPDKQLILWDGPCEVHVRFSGEEIRELKHRYPGIHVMVHPECPPDVIAEADYTGSTSGMIRHIGDKGLTKIALITECSMSDNVTAMYPGLEVVRPCNLCPHMQRITLGKVVSALRNGEYEITVPEDIRARAVQSLERMISVKI